MASIASCGLQRAGKVACPVSSSQISALRIKPFVNLRNLRKNGAPSQQAPIRPKVAEAEAPVVDDDDFEFSLSEAKRNNEYSPADVEAALKAYFEGVGSLPYEKDFITNPWGVEDASFHSDLDDQEGYIDEYASAGIAEAAPRKRRNREDGDNDEDEILDSAKEAAADAALKDEIELRNIQADLEDAGVFNKTARQIAEDQRREADFAPGVWDWMAAGSQDPDGDLEDLEKLTSAQDVDLYDNLANADQIVGDLDETTKDIISFLVEDDLENFAKLPFDQDDDADDSIVVDEQILPDGDSTRISGLFAEVDNLLESAVPDLEESLVASAKGYEPDYEAVDENVASNFLQQLRAVKPVDLSEEQVKQLLDGKDELGEPLAQVVSLAEVPSEPAEVTVEFESSFSPLSLEQLQSPEEPEEPDMKELGITDIVKSIKELEEYPLPEFVPPTEEELNGLDEYLISCQQYVEDDEARKKAINEAVQRGELPESALEEDDDSAFVTDGAPPLDLFKEDPELTAEAEEETDDEQWVERVVELKRVTKVVKGGKLMGFRAVAVVGNQKGLVGVGCASGRDVASAVRRALVDAKKYIIQVPLVGAATIPHKIEVKYNSARCVILPAADGTGCIAGGAIRQVLEVAGIKNALAKRLGCRSLLNNARCTIKALSSLQPLYEVSKYRGVPFEELLLVKN